MSPSSPNPPNRRPIAAIVIGGFVGVVAAVFLAAGGALFWGESEKDADGYLSTGSDRYATTTNAIATEDLDLGDGGTGWVVDQDAYGKIRLQVEPQGDKPVFVGIAPTDRVDDYLAGTRHTTRDRHRLLPVPAPTTATRAAPAARPRPPARTSGPPPRTAPARRPSPGTSSPALVGRRDERRRLGRRRRRRQRRRERAGPRRPRLGRDRDRRRPPRRRARASWSSASAPAPAARAPRPRSTQAVVPA